jgi:uncharacterized 2Fe-2S/4Fe-4S cluster protein (DUF4445 family)
MLFGKKNKKEDTPKVCIVTLRYKDNAIEEYTVPYGTKLDSVLDGHTTIETHCIRNIDIDRTRPPRFNQPIIDAHNNCKVEVYGEVSPPSKSEQEILLKDKSNIRLACQAVVKGNCEVRLPHEQLWRPTNEKLFDMKGNELKFNQPEYTESFARTKQVNSTGDLCIAYEIGMCTLRAALFDAETGTKLGALSCLNPQYEFAHTIEDRMEYIRQGGAAKLWDVLVIGLNKLTADLIEMHNISPDKIVRASIVGDTQLMEHYLGPNKSVLKEIPRAAPEASHFPAKFLGLEIGENTELFVIPAIDNVSSSSVIAGLGTILHKGDYVHNPLLLITLESTSSVCLVYNGVASVMNVDTGCIFGGSALECGAPYIEGAVDHVGFNNSYPSMTTLFDKPSVGIAGTALVDIVAGLIDNKLIKRNGELENGYSFYQLPEELYITVDEIQQLRKAKMLIRTAVDTLCYSHGIELNQIDEVHVCGGFGTTYNLDSLITVGLLPKFLEMHSSAIGDLALKGAGYSVLNSTNMLRIMNAYRTVRTIDTTKNPRYSMILTRYQNFTV